jgi:N-acetylglutamate synthase-like GNAT family acetyltransferase
MIIRQASLADLLLLVNLLRRSFVDVAKRFNLTVENCPKNLAFCTEQRIRDDFNRGLEYYLLEKDGQPLGCVALEKAGPEVCYLERLAVLPEQRRKGFGKVLVDRVFDRAGKIGARRVEIGIISEDKELRDWYKKFGFIEKGTKEFEHLPFVVAFMFVEL